MKNVPYSLGSLVVVVLLLFASPSPVLGEIGDCPAGYEFQPSSGVGCVQINCSSFKDAHYSYTSRCICGSAGSINEDPTDPNKSCNHSNDFASCPGCLYACVHTDEECPAAPGETQVITNSSSANANTKTNANANKSVNTNSQANSNASQAGNSLSTTGTTSGPTCVDECNKFLRGKTNATVILAEGELPECKCQIDVRGVSGGLTETISADGPVVTTYTFDPSSGELIATARINRKDEVEKIRKRLGYKYTEKQIDELLAPDKVDAWFEGQIKNIKTSTNLINPQFWWQHVVAVLDHGFDGNSADFVDTYQFGRCGDSMQWLERDLSRQLHLGDDPDEPGQKHEAMLSITGEKYGNMLNHTSLLIRPAGMTNSEWEDIVKELKKLSGGTEDNPGIQPGNIQGVDARLLDAKVLDPYKKQITTVREFIKGWSYIRIS